MLFVIITISFFLKSRFVTYLLNFPRTSAKLSIFNIHRTIATSNRV